MPGHSGEVVPFDPFVWLIQAGRSNVHGDEVEVLSDSDESQVVIMYCIIVVMPMLEQTETIHLSLVGFRVRDST